MAKTKSEQSQSMVPQGNTFPYSSTLNSTFSFPFSLNDDTNNKDIAILNEIIEQYGNNDDDEEAETVTTVVT